MSWTAHGHHIPGTIMYDDRPEQVARCGGPGMCGPCTREVARHGLDKPRPNIEAATERLVRLRRGLRVVHDSIPGDWPLSVNLRNLLVSLDHDLHDVLRDLRGE